MPLCDTQPCINEGICEAASGTFRCICAQIAVSRIVLTNFLGNKAGALIDFVTPTDDSVILSVTFIAETGFTGPDCSQIVDPCSLDNPCKHGADCVPLQLGRFKCKCLPGWTGPTCHINIGKR
uniref:EGF-like domain-containing protein n=1 Tax=Parascaris equorum TaxID=6256 RepID=A0A914S6C9_PAREQ